MILQRTPTVMLPSWRNGARTSAALGVALLWGIVEFAALCRSRWLQRRRRGPIGGPNA